MTIAFSSAGAAAAGTTALAVPFPAAIAEGDLLVLLVANKYPTNGPATPTGWVLAKQDSGGHGASAADAGSVYCSVFYRIASGIESALGTQAVAIASGNVSLGQMFRYTKSASKTWSIDAASGSDSTPDTAWSVTTGAFGLAADDLVLALSAINTDVQRFSAEAIAATGLAFDVATERSDQGDVTGDDIAILASEHPVLTGAASVAATYTATAVAATADSPCGATVLLRLREEAIPTRATALRTSETSLVRSGTGVIAADSATLDDAHIDPTLALDCSGYDTIDVAVEIHGGDVGNTPTMTLEALFYDADAADGSRWSRLLLGAPEGVTLIAAPAGETTGALSSNPSFGIGPGAMAELHVFGHCKVFLRITAVGSPTNTTSWKILACPGRVRGDRRLNLRS